MIAIALLLVRALCDSFKSRSRLEGLFDLNIPLGLLAIANRFIELKMPRCESPQVAQAV
jgi:hypothetical protein